MKFEDEMKEDLNLGDAVGEDNTGGAILSAKLESSETVRPVYDDVKLPAYTQPSSSIQYASFMSSALDMIPTTKLPFFQYEPEMQATNEKMVLQSILKGVTGKGAFHDHPMVARAVVETLKENSELLHLYTKNHG